MSPKDILWVEYHSLLTGSQRPSVPSAQASQPQAPAIGELADKKAKKKAKKDKRAKKTAKKAKKAKQVEKERKPLCRSKKSGKMVDKQKSDVGKRGPWILAVMQARAELHLKGFVACKKGAPLYVRATQLLLGLC